MKGVIYELWEKRFLREEQKNFVHLQQSVLGNNSGLCLVLESVS
jgi:hypothetical protein